MSIIKNADYTDGCNVYFEHTISFEDLSYLIMFGHHVNGGFICVLNHGWACEASDSTYSVDFNMNNLIRAGATPEVALEIARYIDNWIRDNEDAVSLVRSAANDRMMDSIRKMMESKTSDKPTDL